MHPQLNSTALPVTAFDKKARSRLTNNHMEDLVFDIGRKRDWKCLVAQVHVIIRYYADNALDTRHREFSIYRGLKERKFKPCILHSAYCIVLASA